MTELLAVILAAAAFTLFGYFMRGRQRACGSGCSCEALPRDGVCAAPSDQMESGHEKR